MRSVTAVHHTTEKKAKSLSGTHTETQRSEQIEDAIRQRPVEQMAMSVACAKWIPHGLCLRFSRSGLLRLKSRVCAFLNVRLTD